jgi:hypothetical protein
MPIDRRIRPRVLVGLVAAVPLLWLLLPLPVVPIALLVAAVAALASRWERPRWAAGLLTVSALILVAELAAGLIPPLKGNRPGEWADDPSLPAVASPERLGEPFYPGLLAAPGPSLQRWILRGKKTYTLDPDLGWIPGPNQTLRMPIGDRLVLAHTDSHGARVGIPPTKGSRGLLLFGCSVCFGWGVEDHETFGRIVADRSHGRLVDVNLGIPSGGPHQAYALVSAERERPCLPEAGAAAAVLMLLPHHVYRVLGAYRNAGESPRFELVDGQLVRRGQYDIAFTNATMLPRWWFVQKEARKSLALGRLWEGATAAYEAPLEARYVQRSYGCALAAELVRATADVMARRYGIRTLVLLWPHWKEMRIPLKAALRARGIEPVDLAEVAPGLERQVLEGDPDAHPSAEGHRRIAQAIESWLQATAVE